MTCALPAIHSCLVEFDCVSHLVELDGVSRSSKILPVGTLKGIRLGCASFFPVKMAFSLLFQKIH